MKHLRTLVILLVAGLALAACGNGATRHAVQVQRTIVRQDVTDIESQLAELRRAEPLPSFTDSAALRVQDAYYTADADPNKKWYVILVNYQGQPYAQYTTRGAPQPSGDQVTNPQQLYCQHVGGGSNIPDGCGTIGLPEPNGVHQGGAVDSYVAILTTGAVIRFPGDTAHISDQPFNIKGAVNVQIDETAAISHTDTSKTTHPFIPKGTSRRESQNGQ